MAVIVSVGVYIENEVFGRGIEVCIREDPGTRLVIENEAEPPDVVVVTPVSLSRSWDCAVVVCTDSPLDASDVPPSVMGVVPMRSLTPAQLVSAVRAAAFGLRVGHLQATAGLIGPRGRDVLRLLAEGAGTREISDELGFSERTIKGVIAGVERELGARSRAHAVALAMKQALI